MTDPDPQSPRYSLFSSDTLDGLREATAQAARAAEAGDAQAVAALRVCERVAAAVAASDAGRQDEARQLLTEALAETADTRLLFLGFQFHFRSSEYDRAEHFVRRRLDVADPESAEAARAWNNLGLIHHFRGDAASAESMMRRSLEIDRRIGNDFGIARDLGNLALIPEARGDLDAAEQLNREALSVAERIGAEPIIASKLCNLGEIAIARGRPDDARPLLVRAESMYRSLGIEKYRVLCEQHLRHLDLPR